MEVANVQPNELNRGTEISQSPSQPMCEGAFTETLEKVRECEEYLEEQRAKEEFAMVDKILHPNMPKSGGSKQQSRIVSVESRDQKNPGPSHIMKSNNGN